jgi:cellulose synthase/poly-beta-1,6-N-acetylglucosamine synthase-like glycosyltransferase
MPVRAALSATIRLPGSDTALFHLWLPFGLLGLIGWTVWLARRLLTSRYRPFHSRHWEPSTVVAPCFREEPEIVAASVRSWLAAGAAEVILVFPEDEHYNVARARAAFGDQGCVRYVRSADPEKRFMLAAGIRRASHEIVVLSDSDTMWDPDCLRNLLMPFAARLIGGVGTRQRVLSPEGSVWRRAADWCLDAKYLTYLPAMARVQGVSCLSGRTVAYRRHILLDVLDELTGETFFGRRCVSGDDGRLTWLVLTRGYGTTYQRNAVAWTVMPDDARGFFLQRTRWARNSYRCYLRAIGRGWLFEQPLITRISVLQGLIAPLSLTVSYVFVALALARGSWVGVALWLAWIMVGRAIRAFDHLRERPRDIVLLPLMTGVLLFAMTIVKFWSLVTLNRQAWLTRDVASPTPQGQSLSTFAEPLTPAAFLDARTRFAEGDA